MALVNLSFAACGFLGIYHLGVVAALLRHGDKLLDSLRACAGASAGALVAAVVVTAPDKLEHCKEFTYRFANNVRKQKLGALSPGYDFMLELRDGMEEILPPDAHLLANKCLHVSITHFKTGKNRMVSSFTTREDLIKVLLASSFVPVYAGMKPVEFQGQTMAVKMTPGERWEIFSITDAGCCLSIESVWGHWLKKLVGYSLKPKDYFQEHQHKFPSAGILFLYAPLRP
ncbi:patatin-like phospholipase domain-containing protein 4 isoform X2 [Electrophorus electricus]|uniref:patatin-like phospholipase domain-containing protein 4 isoform X2 n=1 Tax=Electrophorus electricus TaxID=8005 RepID=UPI0015D0678A|nr:patatin-like phospholipase domain-containing protein 4 isoform X2 [Electrophorus electricus]